MNVYKRTIGAGLAGLLLGLGIMMGTMVSAPATVQAADTDFAIWNPCWWANNPWGKDDKRGSVNLVSPAIIKRALSTVKRFKSATLGKPYARDIAFFGPRSWNLSIPGTPTGGPFGKNNLIYHDEMLTTEIGQVGTQFDGPGHIGVRTPNGDMMYNGRSREKVYEHGKGGRIVGMGDAGVEHVAEIGFICRGVLIDAAGYKNMKMLPIPAKSSSPGVVTKADIQGALKKQGTGAIQKGDCVFLYTGWGDLWGVGDWASWPAEKKAKKVALAVSGEPGYGPDACEWFGEIGIMMTGGDTSANDAQPNDHGLAVPCHSGLQTRLGIWNLENLDFSQLLADKVYEFAFVWAPLKMVGATGSPGNPIAIY